MKINKIEKLTKTGADWYQDRYEAVRVERNRYFTLLMMCLMALLAAIGAIALLTPLKTTVPYLIETNKTDGETTVLKPLDFKSLNEKQNVTLYFLYKYLHARMNYNYGLRQLQADTVRGLSNAPVYAAFAREINVSNPQSPTRIYQNNVIITTKINSYSFPYPNIAQIHFSTEQSAVNGDSNQEPVRKYWLATIKFTYSQAAISSEDKLNINPVGFFVTDFQLNPETPVEVHS